MKDMHNDILAKLLFGPVVLAADNTPAALDMKGSRASAFLICVGVGGITFDATNKIEFKLTHSDTDSNYVAVTAADVEIIMPNGTKGVVGSGGIVRELIAAHAAATITKVGYIGNKKFRKMLADFSGTHGTGTPIAVLELLGALDRAPAGV